MNKNVEKVDEISMKIINAVKPEFRRNLQKKRYYMLSDSENFNEIYISYDNIQYQNIYYLAEYIDGNFN